MIHPRRQVSVSLSSPNNRDSSGGILTSDCICRDVRHEVDLNNTVLLRYKRDRPTISPFIPKNSHVKLCENAPERRAIVAYILRRHVSRGRKEVCRTCMDIQILSSIQDGMSRAYEIKALVSW